MLARAVSSQPSRTLIHCGERCTQQWLPRLAAQPASAAIQSLTPARRSYATKKVLRRSPTVVRAERAAERSRTPALAANTQDADLYDPASVPPLDYFENAAVVVPTGFLSPQEARDLILQYITVMLKEKDRLPWKAILQENNTSPEALHNAACLLLSSPRLPEQWILGLHMLHVASEQGHLPSTLTIVSFQNQVRRDREPPERAAWLTRAAQKRFDAYLASAEGQRDPDALTLAGLAAAREGDDARAARWLRRAVERGNERAGGASLPDGGGEAPPPREPGDGLPARAPRWSWEAAALVRLGEHHARREQPAQAASYLRTAALELDDAAACAAMARLLVRSHDVVAPDERPYLRWYLFKAAASGSSEAAFYLGVLEMELARRGGPAAAAAADHERTGREWLAIASQDKGQDMARLLALYNGSDVLKVKVSDAIQKL